jgi:transposase
MLLLADENHSNGHQTDQEIAEKLDSSQATVERTRQRYTEGGLAAALHEQPRSGRPPGISGETRAKITALACTTPPPGYARWSLRLLADKAVALELIDTISHDAVGTILKKTSLNRT